MITLTAEQAQQIEEALLPYAYQYVEMGAAYTVTKSDALVERALTILRAARANFQCETSIENNPADSFKANYPVAWKCLCGANLYIDSDGSPASKAEQAEQADPVAYFLDVKAGFSSKPLYEQVSDEYKNDADVFPLYAAPQPVSQEYQDHLVNQSFDWAEMAAKHQFMEGYRIGLAEMREKCAVICEAKQSYSAMHANTEFAAVIRAINFEGDTGFRPVSEMVGCAYCNNPLFAGTKCNNCGRITLAEQAEQDLDTCPGCGGVADNGHDREFPPNPYYCTKCSEQAEQEPVAWVGKGGFNECGEGKPLYAAPVRTKDLTGDELSDLVFEYEPCENPFKFARAVIQEFRRKNDII